MKSLIQFLVIIVLFLLTAAGFPSCTKTHQDPPAVPPSSPPAPAPKYLVSGKTDSFAPRQYLQGPYDTTMIWSKYMYDGQGHLLVSIDSTTDKLSNGLSQYSVLKATLAYNVDGYLTGFVQDTYEKNSSGNVYSDQRIFLYEYTNGKLTKYVAGPRLWLFTYDNSGRLASFSEPSDTVTYQYNGATMIKMTDKTHSGAVDYDVTMDAKGHIVQMKDPFDEIDLTYDASGNMVEGIEKNGTGTVIQPQTNLQAIYKNTYDSHGNLTIQEQNGTSAIGRPVRSLYT